MYDIYSNGLQVQESHGLAGSGIPLADSRIPTVCSNDTIYNNDDVSTSR